MMKKESLPSPITENKSESVFKDESQSELTNENATNRQSLNIQSTVSVEEEKKEPPKVTHLK